MSVRSTYKYEKNGTRLVKKAGSNGRVHSVITLEREQGWQQSDQFGG